jgi:thiamine biosynthesis lipoprotein
MSSPFRREVESRRFRALGTTVDVTGVGIDRETCERAVAGAIDFAAIWEATFSRFRSDSELSRLNAATGGPRRVSPDLIEMIAAAQTAYLRTGGRFDPTILPNLENAGYDRDFPRLTTEMARQTRSAAVAAPAPGMAGIQIDRADSTVVVPKGTRLDFGGIAKGAFVDRLAERFARWPGGCVDAGGDLRVWGNPPSGSHWFVGVEAPHLLETDVFVAVILDGRASAIATSGTNRRRWRLADEQAHHIIDPATGRPTTGDLLSVTAFAASTTAAEVATKALLVAAARGEPLDPIDAAFAVITGGDGRSHIVEGNARDACSLIPVAANRHAS